MLKFSINEPIKLDMKNRSFIIHSRFIVYIFLHFTIGCVSIQMPPNKGIKATEIEFVAPAEPFTEIKSESMDRAWLSSKTANTISFISDCNNPSDPSLEQIQNETWAVMTKLNVVDSKNFIYNGREAISTTAIGEVDGVPVQMQVLVFKKNNCSYTLNYGGVSKYFDSEIEYFNSFIKKFKAP